MTTTERITDLQGVWTILLPDVEQPADHQWSLWMMQHDPETVQAGLIQLAAKFNQLHGAMDADYRTRFSSSIMNRITRERRSAVTL